MNTTITRNALRAHLRTSAALWQGRTTDAVEYGDDDTHLDAWSWVARPDEVELFGARVQVMHPEFTGGHWLEVVRTGNPAPRGLVAQVVRS